jgi:hypothetical protein
MRSMPSGPPAQAGRTSQTPRGARDKRQANILNQLLIGAALRSIPTGPPKTKQELFTSGALKSVQFAPRGHGYYDAYVQKPETATVSATTGPATTVGGYSTETIPGYATVTGTWDAIGPTGTATPNTHTGNATLLEFNPGSSDFVVGRVHTLTSTDGVLGVSTKNITVTQFANFGPTSNNGSSEVSNNDGDPNSHDANPTRRIESIPLRGSLRIRNVTEALSVGGVVRTLRYNGGIALNADGAAQLDAPNFPVAVESFLSVCDMIRDAPRTKVHSGHELREMHQSNTYPADFIRSMQFHEDRSYHECVRFPGYCTLLVLIDDFAASTNLHNNTYEVNVMVQRAARFQMGSLLHGMARDLRVKPASDADAQLQAEQNKPHLRPLGREGAGPVLRLKGGKPQLALTM